MSINGYIAKRLGFKRGVSTGKALVFHLLFLKQRPIIKMFVLLISLILKKNTKISIAYSKSII